MRDERGKRKEERESTEEERRREEKREENEDRVQNRVTRRRTYRLCGIDTNCLDTFHQAGKFCDFSTRG